MGAAPAIDTTDQDTSRDVDDGGWVVELRGPAGRVVVWSSHTTRVGAERMIASLSKPGVWRQQTYTTRDRWSFTAAPAAGRTPRFTTRDDALNAASALLIEYPPPEDRVVRLEMNRPPVGEHPREVVATWARRNLRSERVPDTGRRYPLTDRNGGPDRNELVRDLIATAAGLPRAVRANIPAAVHATAADDLAAVLDELDEIGTGQVDLADLRACLTSHAGVVELVDLDPTTVPTAAPSQPDGGVGERFDPDGLGLIDVAAIDDEDGGLDDGIHTRFPTRPDHVGRAEQARRQWQAAQDAATLEEFDAAALAASTRAKYAHAWAEFGGFCLARGIADPVDAGVDDVRRWIHTMTEHGLRPSTINARIAGIRHHFEAAGRISPTTAPAVSTTMQAARRRIGTGQIGRTPLMLDDLRRVVAGLPTTLNKPPEHLRVRRDRALLLVGWAAALRASEIVALDLDDVAIDGDPDRPQEGGGVRINIERSETDQTADGAVVAIPWAQHHTLTCPARSLIAWQRQLTRTGHTTGALFRSINRHNQIGPRLTRQTIHRLVKDHIAAIGLDPTPYGAHSLRAGYVTELTEHNVTDATIQRTTRHRSRDSLARYDRPADLYTHNGLAGEWW